MLILTRKLGENIRIGDKIKVIVLDIHQGQVKLGIDAPPNVAVHREEIYERIRERERRVSRTFDSPLAIVAQIFSGGRKNSQPEDQGPVAATDGA